MSSQLYLLFEQLPDYLGGHLMLAIPAIVLGVLISVPLGVVCVKSVTIRGPVVSLVSLVQTVPSIALLAIMVALLGGTIGYWPAFIALLIYSILPIVRNTIVGLESVDPAMREAAKAVGMRPLQQLFRVELPLAFPVILAGIRTATVWVVGIATLSTPVGAPSLGNYIFSGLQLRDWQRVIFGCVATMTLSLVLDQLIAVIEKSIQSRRRMPLVIATCVMLGIVVTGIASGIFAGRSAGFSNMVKVGTNPAKAHENDLSQKILTGQRIRIGAKGITEQFILAEVLREKVEGAGGVAEVLGNMGSTIVFDALAKDTIDVYVGYTGTIWSTVLKENAPIGRVAMRASIAGRLYEKYGIVLVGPLGFENTYALVGKSQTLQRFNLQQIGDLAPIARDLKIGGDPEFFGRPEWQRVRKLYALTDINEVGMDSTFMYQAVADDQVDIAAGFSTDGRIDAFDLGVLDDPKRAFPPYDAVLLLSPKAAKNNDLVNVLEPLVNQISVSAMRFANGLVDEKGISPKEAAITLLSDETL